MFIFTPFLLTLNVALSIITVFPLTIKGSFIGFLSQYFLSARKAIPLTLIFYMLSGLHSPGHITMSPQQTEWHSHLPYTFITVVSGPSRQTVADVAIHFVLTLAMETGAGLTLVNVYT